VHNNNIVVYIDNYCPFFEIFSYLAEAAADEHKLAFKENT
jgi:hypothetical protein